MKSLCTGESYVERPLSADRFFADGDADFIIDWFCNLMDVDMPAGGWKRTNSRTDSYHGSYNPRTETINFTKPYAGVILHELAHHVCHKKGLNGHGRCHDYHFGEILQEMIDYEVI